MSTILTERLGTELLAARRAGDRATVSALRTAIAALDNAEAVSPDDVPAGTTETERRRVGEAEQRGIVRAEVDDLHAAAAAYDAVDPARASVARTGAATLERVLAETH